MRLRRLSLLVVGHHRLFRLSGVLAIGSVALIISGTASAARTCLQLVLRKTLTLMAVALAVIPVSTASASGAVNSPAGHITRLSFRAGQLSRNPTFFVSFSFNGCPRFCIIEGSPVFSLHRGLSAKGPRVTLGTYLYRYDFDDVRAMGSTQLKPNLRSLDCRPKRPTSRWFTVVMSATASESSGSYPITASRAIRVLCQAR